MFSTAPSGSEVLELSGLLGVLQHLKEAGGAESSISQVRNCPRAASQPARGVHDLMVVPQC